MLEARLQPSHGEKVAQPQALEVLLFQASQLESGAVLAIHLNQVKGPNVQEHLAAPRQLLDKDLLLLVVPLVLPAVAGLLVVDPWVLEVECPRVSVALAQLACRPLQWSGGDIYEPLV